jgi:hypothetical protein
LNFPCCSPSCVPAPPSCASQRGSAGSGALSAYPCPALGSLPIFGHVAAPPAPLLQHPHPWFLVCSVEDRCHALPVCAARPSPPRTRVTNADRLCTGEPLRPWAWTIACTHVTGHAGGGVTGLWGVSRAQSDGTDYAEDHQREHLAEREDALGAAQGRVAQDRGAVRSAACSRC